MAGARGSGRDRARSWSPAARRVTRDDRYLAAAPLEDKFWANFTEIIGLPQHTLSPDDEEAIRQVAAVIARRPAAYWIDKFKGRDVCTVQVTDLEDAVKHPHFIERGLFGEVLEGADGSAIPALPVPICAAFRTSAPAAAPDLGDANTMLPGARAS
jgi:alpha-methylacyl-CoA racemase